MTLGPSTGSRRWLTTACALLPLLLTGALLQARWTELPARFPIHWGIDGVANGWANRTILSVFGPLFVAAALICGFIALGEVIARRSPAHTGSAPNLRTARVTLRAAAWLIALLFSAFSLLTLTPRPAVFVPIIIAGCICFSLGMVAYIVYSALRTPPEALHAAQSATEARFWKAGLLYYNPADPALMVPKREGFGHTMNFARPAAWLLLGAILILPLALPLLLHLSARH